MKKNVQGFTFIEIMFVLTIIAVLAAYGVPAYMTRIERARYTEAIVLAGEIKKDVVEYYEYVGEFPMDNSAAGLPEPEKIIGRYVESITIIHGAVDIKLYDSIESSLENKNKILTFRPAIVMDNPTGPITWLCGSEKVPEGMTVIGEDHTTVQVAECFEYED